MNSGELEAWATAVGAVIALIAMFVSVHYSHKSLAYSREATHAAEFQTLQDWRRDVRVWAASALDELVKLEYCLKQGATASTEEASSCVQRLSSLVDQGRYMFPNQDSESHGQHKLPAFRGYRHAVLDPLVAAVQIGEGASVDGHESPSSAVGEMRRLFLSLTQSIINPQLQNESIAALIRQAHGGKSEDTSVNGLLRVATGLPPGAEALRSKNIVRI